MKQHDKQYLDFLNYVNQVGVMKSDRTGTGTKSVFGYDMRFNIQNNVIPVLTTKKMHWPSLIHEIIWYISGDSNIKYLQDNGVRIWNEWADGNGDLGPVYGKQWRSWPHMELADSITNECLMEFNDVQDADGFSHAVNADIKYRRVDQIKELIDTLRKDPDNRRLIVSAWNVGQLPEMKLPPCHAFFQFYTRPLTTEQRIKFAISSPIDYELSDSPDEAELDQKQVPTRALSCKLTQRSADIFLGVPFNIAQYSILTCVIAKIVGMFPDEFIWSGGDCHIYQNHFNQVAIQLARNPYDSPTLVIDPSVDNIDNLVYDDLSLINYQSHPTIPAKVAV